MSIDLFSDDWASMPIENPLTKAIESSERRIFSAIHAGPVILVPRVILPTPVIAEIPDLTIPTAESLEPSFDDTHVLAFVAQAYYYGHRDPSLEPTHTNSAGRSFFDTEAVTRFAKSLTHQDDDNAEGSDLQPMTPECWRLAIVAARRTGRKGARRC